MTYHGPCVEIKGPVNQGDHGKRIPMKNMGYGGTDKAVEIFAEEGGMLAIGVDLRG